MKYNDNGEYKDIYIKTFDTLPVGTEVDYDGSVVPDGWTAVSGYDIIYNTDTTFTTSSQIVNIANMSNYNRLRVKVNNSYARSFFIYFEKIDILSSGNTMATILSMANGTTASLIVGRVTLLPNDNQIEITLDKDNETFPLTLKEIIGWK